jgi:hypothetical protein
LHSQRRWVGLGLVIIGNAYQESVTERDHITLPLQSKGTLMSLKAESVDRQEVLDLAALSVEGAANDGGMIPADMEARRLLEAHPDCQISFEELRDVIAQLAIDRGVGVEYGLRPGQNSN